MTDSQICAGGVDGKDSCKVLLKHYFVVYNEIIYKGDSGGPFLMKKLDPNGKPVKDTLYPYFLMGIGKCMYL